MRKIDELGKDFDSKMVQWKNQVEHQRKMENSLTAIEKCLLSKSCDVVNSRDASAKEALGVSYTVVDESRAVGNHAARIETAFEPEHLKIHVSSTEPEDCVILLLMRITMNQWTLHLQLCAAQSRHFLL